MTKKEFLDKLRLKLEIFRMMKSKRQSHIYEEMISDRMEDGATETEAVASLGTPEAIARDLQAIRPFDDYKAQSRRYKSKRNPESTALIVVLLVVLFPVWFPVMMSALGVIASFFATIGAIIIALWVVSVAIGIAASP
jgi:uncharacterized membrane protein